MKFVPLILVGLLFVPTQGWAAGDAAKGHALASTWCANCHVVADDGQGKDVAPPFPEVARRGAPDQLSARAFLEAPHPPMPDLNLSRQEIDDVVAYLNSLAHR